MRYVSLNSERAFEDSGIPAHVLELRKASKYLFSIKVVNGIINIPATNNKYMVDDMIEEELGANPTEDDIEYFFDGLTSLFDHIGISEAMQDDFYSDDVAIATETAREIKDYLIDNFIDEGGEDEINELAHEVYLSDWLTLYDEGGACDAKTRKTKENRVLTRHKIKIDGEDGCQYRPANPKSVSKASPKRGESSSTRQKKSDRKGKPEYAKVAKKATLRRKNSHISDSIPKKKIKRSDCTSKQELVTKIDPKTKRKYTVCRVKEEYEGYTGKHTNRGRKMSPSAIAKMLRTKEKLGLIEG